jgi:predicted nucleic-acid-binding protein
LGDWVIAVDTNVLVRFAVEDDRQQADAARQLFSEGDVFVPKTVLLETEWVLRAIYRKRRSEIAGYFRKLLDLRGATCEDETQVKSAVEWFSSGMDFADALHLAASTEASVFVTFDESLRKAASKVGARPPAKIPRRKP